MANLKLPKNWGYTVFSLILEKYIYIYKFKMVNLVAVHILLPLANGFLFSTTPLTYFLLVFFFLIILIHTCTPPLEKLNHYVGLSELFWLFTLETCSSLSCNMPETKDKISWKTWVDFLRKFHASITGLLRGSKQECAWSHFENSEGLQKRKRSLLSPYEKQKPNSLPKTTAPNTESMGRQGLWFTVFLLCRTWSFYVVVNIYFTGLHKTCTSSWRLCS